MSGNPYLAHLRSCERSANTRKPPTLGRSRDPLYHSPYPSECKADSSMENEPPEPISESKQSKYSHGNYISYYGYRSRTGQRVDSRLNFFDRRWFENKKVIDIGCNAGAVTLNIAMNYNPSYIEGDFIWLLISRSRY